jgi:predicted methyltransferase MtxX (methanogen marker protein 4)
MDKVNSKNRMINLLCSTAHRHTQAEPKVSILSPGEPSTGAKIAQQTKAQREYC